MFEILRVTPELLAELGAEIGGCDFTDPNQKAFLENTKACDVQAAPGNGKTTLLTAKLALLSRSSNEQRSGVCVISHTNAARSEVESQISNHPTAASLMAYPHFTGTVTGFINQYLALPYLRGLGWTIRQIDDDVFAAEALRRYPYFWALKAQAGRAQMTVERWVSELTLEVDSADWAGEPESLAVKHRKGQHGPKTNCGRALAKLKAGMVKSGLYRYADMTVLARRALESTPGLPERIRARFPLVILDEAQDTNGDQLRLLEGLFKHDDCAFQRLGDSNQTLYEDDGVAPEYWSPGKGSLPLNDSRRFGNEIANFASRLTVRSSQTITGVAHRRSTRVLILFDENTIGNVLGAFADDAQAHWGDDSAEREIWAVASRHSTHGKTKGEWRPISLGDYYPAYRSESGSRKDANRFCRQMQRAALQHAAGLPPRDVAETLTKGLAGLARAHTWNAPNGRAVGAHNLWITLSERNPSLPRHVKRIVYDHILVGEAAWDQEAWDEFVDALLPLFAPLPSGAEETVSDYSSFIEAVKPDLAVPEYSSTKHFQQGEVRLNLGSIHSVKGKSVDGILVVESEVWKGSSKGQNCMDLTSVLPHAFGIVDEKFTGAALTAATNVFVGVTRARELLGLAMRKSTAEQVVHAAKAQGWKVVDLVEDAGLAADD